MCIITMRNVSEKLVQVITCESELLGQQWRRLPDLNRLLKGFRAGEFTVLSGKTGTGKTTFISEYSLDLAESGIKTLWGSFEVSVAKLCKTMLTQFSRKSLVKNPKEIGKYMKEFDRIPMFFIKTQGRDNFDNLIPEMRLAHKEKGIQHVVLDNLQFIVGQVGANSNDKFHAQDKFVGQLRNFVNETNVHLTLIAHPRKENHSELLSINSLYGGCKLAQESDNILLLQSMESQNKKFLQIVKNRHDGALGTMTLYFKSDTLCFSNSKTASPSSTSKSDVQISSPSSSTSKESNIIPDTESGIVGPIASSLTKPVEILSEKRRKTSISSTDKILSNVSSPSPSDNSFRDRVTILAASSS